MAGSDSPSARPPWTMRSWVFTVQHRVPRCSRPRGSALRTSRSRQLSSTARGPCRVVGTLSSQRRRFGRVSGRGSIRTEAALPRSSRVRPHRRTTYPLQAHLTIRVRTPLDGSWASVRSDTPGWPATGLHGTDSASKNSIAGLATSTSSSHRQARRRKLRAAAYRCAYRVVAWAIRR